MLKIIFMRNLFFILFLFLFSIKIFSSEKLKSEHYYDNNNHHKEYIRRHWIGNYKKRRHSSYLAKYYNNKDNKITGLNSSKLLLANPKASNEY